METKRAKKSKDLERHFKGVANHWRIEILMILEKNPGIILDMIVERLGCNVKTISEHTKKLVQAGLINKKYKDRFVEHFLSPYGVRFVKFIKSF